MKKRNDLSFVAARMVFRMNDVPEKHLDGGAGREEGGILEQEKMRAVGRIEKGAKIERLRMKIDVEEANEEKQRAYAEEFRTGDFPFNIDIDGARVDQGGFTRGLVANITDQEGKIIGNIGFRNDVIIDNQVTGVKRDEMVVTLQMTTDGSVYNPSETKDCMALTVSDLEPTYLYEIMEQLKNYQDIKKGLNLGNLEIAYTNGYPNRQAISISRFSDDGYNFNGSIFVDQNGYGLVGKMYLETAKRENDIDLEERYKTIEELHARLLELDKLVGSAE